MLILLQIWGLLFNVNLLSVVNDFCSKYHITTFFYKMQYVSSYFFPIKKNNSNIDIFFDFLLFRVSAYVAKYQVKEKGYALLGFSHFVALPTDVWEGFLSFSLFRGSSGTRSRTPRHFVSAVCCRVAGLQPSAPLPKNGRALTPRTPYGAFVCVAVGATRRPSGRPWRCTGIGRHAPRRPTAVTTLQNNICYIRERVTLVYAPALFKTHFVQTG